MAGCDDIIIKYKAAIQTKKLDFSHTTRFGSTNAEYGNGLVT